MMSHQKITEIYKQAIKTYGKKAQKLMAIEEMADVTITIDQMMLMYKISRFEIGQMRIKKMERLKERMDKAND